MQKMFEYEMHQTRSAELHRAAAEERLARQALRARRAEKRRARAAGGTNGRRQWVKAA
jgi:hypothetical protein